MNLNELCGLKRRTRSWGDLMPLCTTFGEDTSNNSSGIEWIFNIPSPWLTSVISKMRSRSPGSNLVFFFPWSVCVPNFVRIHQIFLQIFSETIFHIPSPWNTSVPSTIRSRSPGSSWVSALPWCLCVQYLVRIHQIILKVLSGNHLPYPAETIFHIPSP